jgi:EAL domain-containing protein (putative c-di-GMP-specific phosphodiesterase class I)
LVDPDYSHKVGETLDRYGLNHSHLEIELTESSVMTAPEQAISQLNVLQSLGVTISVDDFGTGYSSLAYLKHLPLDAVKIDRTFIQDVDKTGDNAAIVNAIIGLSQSLG